MPLLNHCQTQSHLINLQHQVGSQHGTSVNQWITNSCSFTQRCLTTTILRPFFWDHLGEPVPEEILWTLWCKERLTESDTLTIHSIRTNQCPPPLCPHIFLQVGCPSCHPTNSVKALKATVKGLKAEVPYNTGMIQHPFNGLFARTTWVSQHQKG